jgi:plastocyanin
MKRRSTRFPALLAVSAVAALAVAGCGGGSSSSSGSTGSKSSAPAKTTKAAGQASASASGGQTIHLAADPSKLKFNVSTLKAKAGKVTLVMANPANFSHGVSVDGHGVDKNGNVVGHGGTSTVTVTLKPGTYTFFCPVPGHRQAGMQGKLVVS